MSIIVSPFHLCIICTARFHYIAISPYKYGCILCTISPFCFTIALYQSISPSQYLNFSPLFQNLTSKRRKKRHRSSKLLKYLASVVYMKVIARYMWVRRMGTHHFTFVLSAPHDFIISPFHRINMGVFSAPFPFSVSP